MITLTLDELQAVFEDMLSSPTVPSLVQDQYTESIGEVISDLGLVLNEHGEQNQRLLVTVIEAKAHHKKGDDVIWRDALVLKNWETTHA